MKFLALVVVLSVCLVVSGFRPVSVRRDASLTLSMSITTERAAPKAGTLKSVKGRSTGRDDLDGFAIEEGDSTTYEMFAEADGESAHPQGWRDNYWHCDRDG